MSNIPAALRRAMLPELPLLALGVLGIMLEPVRDAVASVPLVGSVAGVVVLLVAALTRRPRAAAVGLMIGVTPPLLGALSADPAGASVLILALIVNLALVAVVRIGPGLPRLLGWGVGLLAVELTAVVTAAEADPGIGTLVATPMLPAVWRGVLPIPDMAVIAALVLVIGATVLAVRRRDSVARALAWTTPLLVLGLSPAAAPVAAVGAGLVLVATLVAGTHALAYRDALTGMPARRAFDEALVALTPPFAIAVVDVDHFKRVNDAHGHDVGDQVLCMVAEQLGRVGGHGRAFRTGGEEFAILFAGSRVAGITPVLEELRGYIEATPFRLRGTDRPKKKPKASRGRGAAPQLAVTVSIGVAEAKSEPTPGRQVVVAADRALYRAKEGGRNRVITARAREYRAD